MLIYIYHIDIYKYVRFATLVESDSKAPFSIATKLSCRGVRDTIPGIVPFYP